MTSNKLEPPLGGGWRSRVFGQRPSEGRHHARCGNGARQARITGGTENKSTHAKKVP